MTSTLSSHDGPDWFVIWLLSIAILLGAMAAYHDNQMATKACACSRRAGKCPCERGGGKCTCGK